MRNTILSAILLLPALSAQQVVAPTPAQVGSTRGTEIGGYNVTNSFETGYRFNQVDGNFGRYRSDVNFGNGIRLLGSNLTVQSRDGHGRYFDQIVLYTLGLGNDPYQSSTLRIEKNRLYRYDMQWRLNEYYNPALTFSQGQHLIDTRRRLQDHEFVLLPQSNFNLRLGYTRNTQTGPALSTVQQFASRGDEFPLFADVRRFSNEYRLGGDLVLSGAKISWLRRWENFREDTPYELRTPHPGDNPADPISLTRLTRTEPYTGSSPGWLVNLRKEGTLWAANGRFTYTGGRRSFLLDETAAGFGRTGAPQQRQILTTGNARRPVTTGDFAVSFYPTERLTLVNNTSVHSTRIDGDAVYQEFSLASLLFENRPFRFLGIRAISNTTDAHFRAAKWLSFYGGYHFSTRRIRSIETTRFDGGEFTERAEQQNLVHSVLFGLRIKPVKALGINLDGELSRADRPFTPISNRNFHALGARADYRVKTLTFSGGYRQNYNINSISVSTHSARARNYFGNAAWSPTSWFALDAGYMKLHLDTVSGLAFFASVPAPNSFVENLRSIYVSNVHAGNFGARFGIGKRTELYAGYSITRDTGDGRARAVVRAADPLAAEFSAVQTYPLRFQSPLARVSVQLARKLRWNAGYQHYGYREDFGLFGFDQNYRAHTGFTSLLWSF